MPISKTALAVLAGVLVVTQVVAALLSLSPAAHTAVAIVTISFAAIGIAPSLASGIGALLPLPVAHLLGLLVAVLGAVQQAALTLPPLAHGIIGAALTILVAFGIVPVVSQNVRS